MAKRNYWVKEGDSLSIIARDELNDLSRWQEIAYINSISAPYTIFPGQLILLPVENGLDIEITEFGEPPAPNGPAAPPKPAFQIEPTTLAMIGIAVVAVFLMMEQK